jgi:hypothetical protein
MKKKAVSFLPVLFMLFFLTPYLVAAPASPGKQRNYMLVFDMTDYSNQLKDAVSRFFKDVFQKGDQLIIVTPERLIGYSRAKLSVPRQRLTADILQILKSDINKGSGRERTLLTEMERVARSISDVGNLTSVPGGELARYTQMRKNLTAIRGNYHEKLLKYSKIFRRVRGDNHLLLFLQPQYRPIPDKETMDWLSQGGAWNRGGGENPSKTFLEENYKSNFDLEEITRIFKYASIRFHFLYMKSTKMKIRQYVQYIDNLGDLYNDFSKLAKATDGLKITTAKPTFFVKQLRRLLIEGKVEVEIIDESMEK